MVKNNTAFVSYGRRNNNDNNNIDNDDDGTVQLSSLPLPLLLLIMNHVGTQEDFVNISVLSKQFYKIVHLPAIETKIIPIYEICPPKNNRGSGRQLLQRLVHNRLHHNEKLKHYHHLRLNRINEFDHDLTDADINDITNNVPPINNVELLDLSLSSASATSPAKAHILYNMGNLLSNVQEINLSHVRFKKVYEQLSYLRQFFGFLSSRQKVIWHHCDRDVYLNGFPFHPTKTRELVADDSIFLANEYLLDMISNLEQRNDIFMFKCLKSLERLSIRNAKYTYVSSESMVDGMNIPQNVLIKFVWNAPTSMRWFCSDLTQENRTMLQQERPEIQLLN